MENEEAVKVAITESIDRLYGPPANREPYRWTARVRSKKFELGSSYSVPIVFGHAPDTPEEWETGPNYVGCHCAFVNSVPEECKACLENTDLLLQGSIPLNHGIVRRSELQSLDPEVVVPYLTENMHWCVLTVRKFSMIIRP